MRALTDASRIEQFMDALGIEARGDARVYVTGGVCAVLLGWRAATIDADIRIVPDRDELFKAVPRLKDAFRRALDEALAGR